MSVMKICYRSSCSRILKMISDACFRPENKMVSLWFGLVEYRETQNTLNNCHIWVYILLTMKIALNNFIFMWFGTRCIVTKTSPVVKFIDGFDFKFPEFSGCVSMWCFNMCYNKNGTKLEVANPDICKLQMCLGLWACFKTFYARWKNIYVM